MTDYWQTTIISEFYTPDINGYYRYVETLPVRDYDYHLRTPYRVQGSVGIIIGNVGLVSAIMSSPITPLPISMHRIQLLSKKTRP